MKNKNFDEIIKRHAKVLKNLAVIEELEKNNVSQKELDIALWLLHNSDGLQAQAAKLHNSHWHLLPGSLLDIYIGNYKNQLISIIKKDIQFLELNPEEVLDLITPQFVERVLGKSFFAPPKQEKNNE